MGDEARMFVDEIRTLSVPEAAIPEGAELVEAYKKDGEYIVMTHDPEPGHNCDHMGCGSIGPHVAFRGTGEEFKAVGDLIEACENFGPDWLKVVARTLEFANFRAIAENMRAKASAERKVLDRVKGE